jgi:hypothetical protein
MKTVWLLSRKKLKTSRKERRTLKRSSNIISVNAVNSLREHLLEKMKVCKKEEKQRKNEMNLD